MHIKRYVACRITCQHKCDVSRTTTHHTLSHPNLFSCCLGAQSTTCHNMKIQNQLLWTTLDRGQKTGGQRSRARDASGAGKTTPEQKRKPNLALAARATRGDAARRRSTPCLRTDCKPHISLSTSAADHKIIVEPILICKSHSSLNLKFVNTQIHNRAIYALFFCVIVRPMFAFFVQCFHGAIKSLTSLRKSSTFACKATAGVGRLSQCP